MHCGHNIDLVRGNIKTKMQPVQRILDVILEPSAANLNLVKDLLHASRVFDQAVEVCDIPVCRSINQLRARWRSHRAKRGKTNRSVSYKRSSSEQGHRLLLWVPAATTTN